MSKSTIRECELVRGFWWFRPSEHNNGCVTSLLQWAAQILLQDIPGLLEKADNDTKRRLFLAIKPLKFKLSDDDLKSSTNKSQQEEESSDGGTPVKTNTQRKTPLSEDEVNKFAQLSQNDKFKAIATALTSSAEIKSSCKRKQEELEYGTGDTLINKNNDKIYNDLDDFLAQKPEVSNNNNSENSEQGSSSNKEGQKNKKKVEQEIKGDNESESESDDNISDENDGEVDK